MHLELNHLIHLYAVLSVTGFIYGSKDDFVKALYHSNLTSSSQDSVLNSIKKSQRFDLFLNSLMINLAVTSKLSGVLGNFKSKVGEIPIINSLSDIKAILPVEAERAHKKLDNLINTCEESDSSVNKISANFKVLSLYIGFISFCFLLLGSICEDGTLLCSKCNKLAEQSSTPIYLNSFIAYEASLLGVICVFTFGLFRKKYFFSAGTISIMFILTTLIAAYLFWSDASFILDYISSDHIKLLSVILIIIPWIMIAVIMAFRNALLKLRTFIDTYILLDELNDFRFKS